MKLYICHESDSVPYAARCRIFGTKKGEKPADGWEVFSTVEFEMPPRFASKLIEWFNNIGDGYSDETLAEPFEEQSARSLTDYIHAFLDRDFVRVAYVMRERISDDGEFAEWNRRVVLLKSP